MTDTSTSTGRRAVTFVAFTILGAALGTVILLAILLRAHALNPGAQERTDPHSPASTSPRTDPSGAADSDTATGVYDVLEMHLPSGLGPECTEGKDTTGAVAAGFAYASVTCTPREGRTVEYASFHDAEAMRTWYHNALDGAGVMTWGRADACHSGDGAGKGPYWMRVTRLHHGATPHLLERGNLTDWTHGMLLCFDSGPHRMLEWYDSDTHIYAWLQGSGDDAEGLFRWWATEAGPDHPPMGTGPMDMGSLPSDAPSMSPSSMPASPSSPSTNDADMSDMSDMSGLLASHRLEHVPET